MITDKYSHQQRLLWPSLELLSPNDLLKCLEPLCNGPLLRRYCTINLARWSTCSPTRRWWTANGLALTIASSLPCLIRRPVKRWPMCRTWAKWTRNTRLNRRALHLCRPAGRICRPRSVRDCWRYIIYTNIDLFRTDLYLGLFAFFAHWTGIAWILLLNLFKYLFVSLHTCATKGKAINLQSRLELIHYILNPMHMCYRIICFLHKYEYLMLIINHIARRNGSPCWRPTNKSWPP